jgi:hypothetical protein
VKVDLTKQEKIKIGRPSSPRWELDIVGYGGRDNILQVVECKSYIDSYGVKASGFSPGKGTEHDRFKLFNDVGLRQVVFNRLRLQLAKCGACRPDAEVKLALACGKVYERDRVWLQKHFAAQGWDLWDESWLREKLNVMAGRGYENQVSAVVAKLLLRGKVGPPSHRSGRTPPTGA